MEMIYFPRQGLDGVIYTREDMESQFSGGIANEIKVELDKITPYSKKEKRCLEFLKNQVEFLLTAKPETLERVKKVTDRLHLFGKSKVMSKRFKKKIRNAFGYERYRSGRLVEHAERLNVKTCCYCNMNYTLLIEQKKAKTIEMKALMQFDHFYDKAKYPHLSMSMYNLIPSCATCNQGKPRKGNLPLHFNPYYTSLFSLYQFWVKDPLQLYMAVSHPEKIEVECKPKKGEDISACDSWFHLSAKYSVHKDIVKEVFDKAQQYPYYKNELNFQFLNADRSYLLRLLLGVYTEEKDYVKRPMSKFVNDLWEQACVFYRWKKLV